MPPLLRRAREESRIRYGRGQGRAQGRSMASAVPALRMERRPANGGAKYRRQPQGRRDKGRHGVEKASETRRNNAELPGAEQRSGREPKQRAGAENTPAARGKATRPANAAPGPFPSGTAPDATPRGRWKELEAAGRGSRSRGGPGTNRQRRGNDSSVPAPDAVRRGRLFFCLPFCAVHARRGGSGTDAGRDGLRGGAWRPPCLPTTKTCTDRQPAARSTEGNRGDGAASEKRQKHAGTTPETRRAPGR